MFQNLHPNSITCTYMYLIWKFRMLANFLELIHVNLLNKYKYEVTHTFWSQCLPLPLALLKTAGGKTYSFRKLNIIRSTHQSLRKENDMFLCKGQRRSKKSRGDDNYPPHNFSLTDKQMLSFLLNLFTKQREARHTLIPHAKHQKR